MKVGSGKKLQQQQQQQLLAKTDQPEETKVKNAHTNKKKQLRQG